MVEEPLALGWILPGAGFQRRDRATDRRDRGPQLVRGVRDELAIGPLDALAVGHVVERDDGAGHAAAGVTDRHRRHLQHDLATARRLEPEDRRARLGAAQRELDLGLERKRVTEDLPAALIEARGAAPPPGGETPPPP